MRTVAAAVLAIAAAPALAGNGVGTNALQAGDGLSIDIRQAFGTVQAIVPQDFEFMDEDVPSICVPKAPGSLDISIDLTNAGLPVSVALTAETPFEDVVRWSGQQNVNECVTFELPDGTMIDFLVTDVSAILTAQATLFAPPVPEDTCMVRRNVRIDDVVGDATNVIVVNGFLSCINTPFFAATITVTIEDAIGFAGTPCPGDVTGDGFVDFSDLNALLAQFGQTGPGLSADLNADGVVDFSDLNALLSRFGVPCP